MSATTDVLGRADLDPCPLEDPGHAVAAATPIWDVLIAMHGPSLVAAADDVVEAMAEGLRLAEADEAVAHAELAVAEAFARLAAQRCRWRPGDPCGTCGSTRTGIDPADGATCTACGATDADET